MSKLIVVPSSAADRKDIKTKVREATDCLVRVEGEKEQIKAIVELVAEKYELPKAFVNRLIKTAYKADFDKNVATEADFQELFEAVMQ
jgi:hypothetical protein